MEKLKIAIADKILEASSSDSEMMRTKLRRIQRFSDFSEALKSMMQKYPEIEEELLRMVNDDDFDTARASRRVDYILNKEHLGTSSNMSVNETIFQEEVEENVIPDAKDVSSAESDDLIGDTILPNEKEETTVQSYSFEDEPENNNEEIVYTTLGKEELEEDDELKRAKNKKLVITILKVILIIGVIVLLYFIFKYYWKYILVATSIALIAFVAWKYYRNKKLKGQ